MGELVLAKEIVDFFLDADLALPVGIGGENDVKGEDVNLPSIEKR